MKGETTLIEDGKRIARSFPSETTKNKKNVHGIKANKMYSRGDGDQRRRVLGKRRHKNH